MDEGAGHPWTQVSTGLSGAKAETFRAEGRVSPALEQEGCSVLLVGLGAEEAATSWGGCCSQRR